ncbi:teichoic acids export ABC transporter ATP-binding subunit TagH [Heyndrickxia sporothermodurans]|uniref:teichoic acids export ABC transporter ATP-binding subunit TagH n=1 Tax=Heyndrickxia sporothermodurans TaxID=46224 RepID=UPI00192B1A81|nr:teichoic acids export ABC transporter ATP-binding subunit TagH [Heyndrickxia sporothermodurans]MBL5805197.1 teichoic acids export ABC transporter ATP-binding subunit TagH [Heyndrickxia sporothermodurans]
MSHSVVFNNVTKRYKMYSKNSEKILDVIIPKGYGEDFYALQNISFKAEPGDVIGVIGVNGAGKSTLSNLITGVIPPTSGNIDIKGDASLIAIASGLDNQLTGRENIELKCLMLGFNKKEIKELTPQIIEFADIGKFIDQPVKKYSSGMKSRLGFAISVNIDPDVLVIDEALSVGDQTFTDKCLNKMNEFKEAGKTIFFISHSMGQVKKFCEKALWLEAGEVKQYGPIKEVLPQYEKFLKEFKAMSKEDQKNFKQMILEKRSKENKIPTLTDEESSSNEVNELFDDHLNRQARGGRKKKGFRLKKLSYSILCVFVLLLLAFSAYHYKDEIKGAMSNSKKTTTVPKQEEKNKDDKKEQPIVVEKDKKDIRYVNAKSAFIRKEADLLSEGISMATFGGSYEIEDEQKDPNEDIDWLKVKFGNDQSGWISSKVLSKVSNNLDDKQIMSDLQTLQISQENIENYTQLIGKSKSEVPQSLNDNNLKFTYSDNDEVQDLTFKLNGIMLEDITNKLGNPDLEVKKYSMLYHGMEYDYVFYLSELNEVTEVEILAIKE